MLLAPREAAVDLRIRKLKEGDKSFAHRYAGALHWCAQQHLLPARARPGQPPGARGPAEGLGLLQRHGHRHHPPGGDGEGKAVKIRKSA